MNTKMRRPSRRRSLLPACDSLEVRNLLSGMHFDFGTATSPLADGYTRVTGATAYTASLGHGWSSGTYISSSRADGTDLERDLVQTPAGTFSVDVPNGAYTVTLTMRDSRYNHDRMAYFLEENLVDTLNTTSSGGAVVRSYAVNVADGRLDLRLQDLGGSDGNAIINALDIVPVPPKAQAPAPPKAPAAAPGLYEAALAKWESQMITYGRKHATALAASKGGAIDPALSATYYDAARVFYQIADYTGDASWNAAAKDAVSVYGARYATPNAGKVPGYWNFARGLKEDFLRTGDVASRDAVLLLAKNASYAPDATPASWTSSWKMSREVAYNLLTALEAESLGAPHRARTDLLADQALGHLDQWTVSRTAEYVRPFMVGLTCEALIAYHAQTGDARVLPAIRTALDWVWDNCWDAKAGGFKYTDIVAPDGSGGTGASPDLNMLIAPAFGWMYHQTGDVTYRDRGDEAFAGGVKGAYLAGAKQFNQNFRWSFDYVSWRSEAPLVTPSKPRSA